MIIIGISGLCLVAILFVLLYRYFSHRSDRFMDLWEREMKGKAEEALRESLQSLERATKMMEAVPGSVKSLEGAVKTLKASRIAMEEFLSKLEREKNGEDET